MVRLASYYASTEIFFTYLRARGQAKEITPLASTSVALEFNFVNHVFPSAGVSGASYMVWRPSTNTIIKLNYSKANGWLGLRLVIGQVLDSLFHLS